VDEIKDPREQQVAPAKNVWGALSGEQLPKSKSHQQKRSDITRNEIDKQIRNFFR